MSELQIMAPRPGEPLDPRLLAKAVGEGRVRGFSAQIDGRARAEPHRAGSLLRQGLRDARALHSRERRMVSDLLYDGFRWGPVLEEATGIAGFEGRYLGWLLLHGLQLGEVPEVDAPRWQAFVDGSVAFDGATLSGSALVWEVLSEQLGERAPAFVAASNRRAGVQLRANRSRTTREKLAGLLARDGIETTPCERAPDGLTVVGRANLQGHRTFAQGLFEIQDEGSQLLAELVPEAERVIDLCAGAGGKSLALAARGCRVDAFDVRYRPLDELAKRARRARTAVRTQVLGRDGELPQGVQAAPVVLVDAPCSGTGTWRRHPELRHRLNSLEQTRSLQAQILDRAATVVSPGGALVYGTCSVLPSENEAQVRAFVARFPDFEEEAVLSLGPDTDGTDGFYGAVLRKR